MASGPTFLGGTHFTVAIASLPLANLTSGGGSFLGSWFSSFDDSAPPPI